MLETLWNIPDLWERLSAERRTILLYGMGNGADKILRVCAEKNIPVAGVFASDGFVRGQSFRGMPVRRWADMKAMYGAENTVVLMAFASSRPEVLENVARIASETTLLAPDVPVFGEGLFDRAFAVAHRAELLAVRELLSDGESRRIFDLVLRYKLSGEISCLLEAVSAPKEVLQNVLRPERIKTAADLGAYTGDTVRSLAAAAPNLKTVYAMEPDARNFRKLSDYAAAESRFRVLPVCAAAWNEETELTFDAGGNRNSSAIANRSAVLSGRPAQARTVRALPLDRAVGSERIDFIKYDVEGSEREAIEGSRNVILRDRPTLLVSLYHRAEDLFALPLFLRREFPFYRRFFLRRAAGVPAWDLNLYVRED